MPRKLRLNMGGCHHNRGIERRNIYRCSENKNKFLEIVRRACRV